MALSDRIWWTFKSKIQTEKRLLASARHAQLLMLWYSFVSVACSVYYLKFEPTSEYSAVAWVVFAVLTLCMAGYISGLGFKERAALVKGSYESLSRLYERAKRTDSDHEAIHIEYEKILGLCENHADIDYRVAVWIAYLSHPAPSRADGGLDRKPNWYFFAMVFKWYVTRVGVLLILYSLPVVIILGIVLVDSAG